MIWILLALASLIVWVFINWALYQMSMGVLDGTNGSGGALLFCLAVSLVVNLIWMAWVAFTISKAAAIFGVALPLL